MYFRSNTPSHLYFNGRFEIHVDVRRGTAYQSCIKFCSIQLHTHPAQQFKVVKIIWTLEDQRIELTVPDAVKENKIQVFKFVDISFSIYIFNRNPHCVNISLSVQCQYFVSLLSNISCSCPSWGNGGKQEKKSFVFLSCHAVAALGLYRWEKVRQFERILVHRRLKREPSMWHMNSPNWDDAFHTPCMFVFRSLSSRSRSTEFREPLKETTHSASWITPYCKSAVDDFKTGLIRRETRSFPSSQNRCLERCLISSRQNVNMKLYYPSCGSTCDPLSSRELEEKCNNFPGILSAHTVHRLLTMH